MISRRMQCWVHGGGTNSSNPSVVATIILWKLNGSYSYGSKNSCSKQEKKKKRRYAGAAGDAGDAGADAGSSVIWLYGTSDGSKNMILIMMKLWQQQLWSVVLVAILGMWQQQEAAKAFAIYQELQWVEKAVVAKAIAVIMVLGGVPQKLAIAWATKSTSGSGLGRTQDLVSGIQWVCTAGQPSADFIL